MTAPFLYEPGAGLSIAELTAARIDGHLVEIGDAFIPADAVETPALRAASLAAAIPVGCAAALTTAAWIHGALATLPVRLSVQRARSHGRRVDRSARLDYRDSLIAAEDLVALGGLPVTTPTRTLADLARCPDPSMRHAARTMAATGVADPDAARRWLWTHASLPHSGAALRLLDRLRTT